PSPNRSAADVRATRGLVNNRVTNPAAMPASRNASSAARNAVRLTLASARPAAVASGEPRQKAPSRPNGPHQGGPCSSSSAGGPAPGSCAPSSNSSDWALNTAPSVSQTVSATAASATAAKATVSLRRSPLRRQCERRRQGGPPPRPNGAPL